MGRHSYRQALRLGGIVHSSQDSRPLLPRACPGSTPRADHPPEEAVGKLQLASSRRVAGVTLGDVDRHGTAKAHMPGTWLPPLLSPSTAQPL